MDQQNNTPADNDPDENNNYPGANTGKKEITTRINPISAAFLGLFGGFLLYQLVGGTITLLIFGTNTEDDSINAVRLMTVAGQVLFMLLPALLLSRMVYENVSDVIKIKKPDVKELALFVAALLILTPLLQAYLAIQGYYIDQWAELYKPVNDLKIFFDDINKLVEETYGNLLSANNVFEGLLIILVVAVVPAISEETLFRGYVQGSFQVKMRPFWAALITAFFFGIFHFNPYGVLPLITLGLFFGFAAYKSDSIVIPMVLHFTNNFIAVIAYFIIGNDDLIEPNMGSTIEIRNSFILFAVLLVLFLALLTAINYYYSQNRTRRSYADLS